MLRRAVLASLVLLAAGSAQASAPEKEAKPTSSNLELAPMALPVVADGQVVNYVFVTIQLNLASTSDLGRWRAREPIIRDAVVKAAHRTPFTSRDDYLSLDETRLRESVKRAAVAVMGPKDLRGVTMLRQIPQKRSGVPRPRTAANPAPGTH
jgi:hypothetical protein